MARNIEIKARVPDLEVVEARTRAIATAGPEDISQDDTFFACAQGRLKLREFADGCGELIHYSRADDTGPKVSDYVRSFTDAPASLREALSRALGTAGRVRKHRRLYLAERTRIHLDRVEGLGTFVELEVVLEPGEPEDAGTAEAHRIMALLGIEPGWLVDGAYVDLLAAQEAAERAPASGDLQSTALLVIDVQRGLCRGRWAAHDIDNVIGRINAVAARVRAGGGLVVFIQHEEDGPLAQGSEGWQLDERLEVTPDDARVRKTATDSFHRTGLQGLLAARGIRALIACGLQSEFCVDSTVRGALARGYPVTLVADAHSTLDNEAIGAAQISAHHNATLANLSSYGPRVRVVPAAEVA